MISTIKASPFPDHVTPRNTNDLENVVMPTWMTLFLYGPVAAGLMVAALSLPAIKNSRLGKAIVLTTATTFILGGGFAAKKEMDYTYDVARGYALEGVINGLPEAKGEATGRNFFVSGGWLSHNKAAQADRACTAEDGNSMLITVRNVSNGDLSSYAFTKDGKGKWQPHTPAQHNGTVPPAFNRLTCK